MKRKLITLALLVAAPPSAIAQEAANQLGEVIVTAQRKSGEYYSDDQTVIGLRRQADSAVQIVVVSSDSRDEDMRKQEIRSMLEAAIRRAPGASVELVTGELELVPVTLTSYRDLIFGRGQRPDTSQISLYIKAKLSGSTGSAQSRIDAFVKSVPPSGRALMEKQGSLTLTIVNPDQYRDEITKLIAKEALKTASFFGPDYGVEVGGLNEELYWAQVSGTEVFLYIPYRFTIKPK